MSLGWVVAVLVLIVAVLCAIGTVSVNPYILIAGLAVALLLGPVGLPIHR